MSRFKKPAAKSDQNLTDVPPTCHLYIAGVGSGLGHTCAQIREALSPYGEIESIEMPPGKRYVFVSYLDESSSTRAKNGLSEKHMQMDFLGGGRLGIVEYAQQVPADVESDIKSTEPEDVVLTQHVEVPGCRQFFDWITSQEEIELLNELELSTWEINLKRRVQHYGFTFSYSTLMLDYGSSPPSMTSRFSELAKKMESTISHFNHGADATDAHDILPLTQLTVNEYQPGQGIASHIDTKNCFGPDIFILNLGSGITMRLQYRGEEEKMLNTKKYIWLPQRSLLLLSGEARNSWSHGIAARLNDKVNGNIIARSRRVSLTFRQALIPGDVPTASLAPTPQELDHVFRVYDNIAVHWNHTRGKRKVHWQRVKAFLETLPAGSLLADIGSGDGKYFGLNKHVTCIGCDRSLNLLQVSREPSHETFCCDAVKLPLVSDMFDVTICIAVLHHLASKDRRVAVVKELVRITRPGGKILVQAWAQEQDEDSRHNFEEQDVLVPWRLQQRFFQPGQSGNSPSIANSLSNEGPCEHVEDDGQDDELIFQRFCHVYKRGELEDICSHVPGCRVSESGWDKGNWYVFLEKFVDIRPLIKGPTMTLPSFVKRV